MVDGNHWEIIEAYGRSSETLRWSATELQLFMAVLRRLIAWLWHWPPSPL